MKPAARADRGRFASRGRVTARSRSGSVVARNPPIANITNDVDIIFYVRRNGRRMSCSVRDISRIDGAYSIKGSWSILQIAAAPSDRPRRRVGSIKAHQNNIYI
ncbi:hypothetical protein EVAR_6726_1 [Eumeta japonica]|uniref:Uncharacterized protein n=1 Tax=Eumeta variegata TaxID=151549 RepID=A0A4C1V3J7_EUMVA|nr:hypothetical protein EVAR_6726_1 [Eumeta japonica]